MLASRTRVYCVITATLLLGQTCARADYMSVSVPLTSNFLGNNVGTVVAEANNEPATVNGLLSGQVRLTFTVNPVLYTPTGQNVGFTNVSFASDLPNFTAPAGWSASGKNIVLPANFAIYEVRSPNDASRLSSVTLLFSGLGSAATLDHVLTPVKVFMPNPEFSPPPQALLFLNGTVDFPGVGGVYTDGVNAITAGAAPEPSTLAMAAVGLAGAILARRWRTKATEPIS